MGYCVIHQLGLSRLITNSCPNTEGVLDNICYLKRSMSIRSSSGSWVAYQNPPKNQQGEGGNKRMAWFTGPSLFITVDGDYLKWYFHDNVLHWQWPSILDFNAMYKYHYPVKIKHGGSGNIFVIKISVMRNTSQFTCMVTCPVWNLALGANYITSIAKVRRMASKTNRIGTNPLQPASRPTMPSREHNKTVCKLLGT